MAFKNLFKRSIIAGATIALAIFSALNTYADSASNNGSGTGANSFGSVKDSLDPSYYIMAPYASDTTLNGVVGVKITVYSATGEDALGFQAAAEDGDDAAEKYIIDNKDKLKRCPDPYYSFRSDISKGTVDQFSIYDMVYSDGRNGQGNKNLQKWIKGKYNNTSKWKEQTSITVDDPLWKSGKQIRESGRILTDVKFEQLYSSKIIECDSTKVSFPDVSEFRSESKKMKEMNQAILKAFGSLCGVQMLPDGKSQAGQQYFIVIYCEPICLTSFNTNVGQSFTGLDYICLTPTMAQYGLDKFWNVFDNNSNYNDHAHLNSGSFLLANLAASCRSIVSTTGTTHNTNEQNLAFWKQHISILV